MTSTNRIFPAFLLCGVAALATLAPRPARGCPFCSAPSLTLGEQYSKADAAVLVQWVSGETPTKEKLGSTTYEVLQVAHSPVKSVEKGKKITLDRYRAGKQGDLSLLLGSRARADALEWGSPLEVTKQSYGYIVDAPPADAKPEKRLAYYLTFLENSDRLVADDAYAEFANAPYKDILPLAKQFPRESLRKWLVSQEIPATRMGLYGLMLGLCGTDEDAALMQAKINENTEGFRLGIDGVIAGYLLLTGEKGLEKVEKSKLDLQKIQRKEIPFSETYAALQALRFHWTYGNGRIPAERLRASMRLALDCPEISDLAIGDLTRWKDWTLHARLMEMYEAEEYSVPTIKRAIVRYMIASTKDVPAGGGEPPGKHVAEGARCLERLRDKDPKLVNEAERYFFLQ
jgi:hypothetical protein